MLIMQKIALSLALGLSLFTGVAHAQTCLPKKVQDLPKLADAREINCVTDEKGKSLGLAIVKFGDKEGMINSKGEWLLPAEYDSILGTFEQGLTLVRKGDKYGYVDTKGKFVIDLQYTDAWNFRHTGLAQVKVNDKWGFINPKNQMVIAPQYDFVYYIISENLYTVVRDEKFGFIDKTGKEIIPIIYDHATPFSEGLATVVQEGKTGFINTKGEVVIPFIYEWATYFENGRVDVRLNGKEGVIDKKGKTIIAPIYDDLIKLDKNIYRATQGDDYVYLDKNGKHLTAFDGYQWVSAFFDGLSLTARDGRLGYINTQGQVVIPFIYDYAQPFERGTALVGHGDNVDERFYIDKKGKRVTEVTKREMLDPED